MKVFAKFFSLLTILALFIPPAPASAAPSVLAWSSGANESAQIKAALASLNKNCTKKRPKESFSSWGLVKLERTPAPRLSLTPDRAL